MRIGRPFASRPRPTLTPGLRWLWRVGGVLWLVIFVPFGTFQAASRLAHEKETVSSSFPAADLAAIDIDNGNGSVTVVGTDTDQVNVTAHVDHGWKKTGNYQQLEGDRLVLRTSCPSFFSQYCTVNYIIEVPADLAINASSDNGKIIASDLTGDLTLDTDNGRVEVNRVNGNLTLRSDNGSVNGHDLRSPGVEADSDNGRVELSFLVPPRAVTATSDNGSVEVLVPEGPTEYRVDADSDHGSVAVGVDPSPTSLRTITAQSDNGSVRVDYGP
jgi:hypothetical protein